MHFNNKILGRKRAYQLAPVRKMCRMRSCLQHSCSQRLCKNWMREVTQRRLWGFPPCPWMAFKPKFTWTWVAAVRSSFQRGICANGAWLWRWILCVIACTTQQATGLSYTGGERAFRTCIIYAGPSGGEVALYRKEYLFEFEAVN